MVVFGGNMRSRPVYPGVQDVSVNSGVNPPPPRPPFKYLTESGGFYHPFEGSIIQRREGLSSFWGCINQLVTVVCGLCFPCVCVCVCVWRGWGQQGLFWI